MISVNVRSRNCCTYSQVKYIGEQTAKILKELNIPEDFIKSVDISEKIDLKFSKPVNQGETTLYLFFGGWRLVTQERNKKSIDGELSIYGINVNLESTLYAPSNNAAYLVKTPEGDIIAELIEGKLLNILLDIVKIEEDNRYFILKQIITDIIVNHFRYDLDVLKKEYEERGKREVIEFLTDLASKELNEAEREVSRIESRIRDYEHSLRGLIDERRVAMAKVEGFRIQSMKGVEGLHEELQKLVNINNVKGISIDGNQRRIVIETNDIYINNASKRYYIGRFNIYINPRSLEVKFINLNNCRRSYWGRSCHHPHVDQNGYPCWGNVGSAVKNYIKQNEFQALASLLIGYLESVNTSDAAGRNITSWDVVNKAGEVVQKGYYYAEPPANSDVYVCSGCQDVFNREGISISRGDVHVCNNCADKYFVCPDCGDVCEIDDAEQCEKCGAHICEDCDEEHSICTPCREAERLAAQLSEPGAVLCQYCNTVINEDELHTCETCGEQGCGNCITFDGRYSCPNHR